MGGEVSFVFKTKDTLYATSLRNFSDQRLSVDED